MTSTVPPFTDTQTTLLSCSLSSPLRPKDSLTYPQLVGFLFCLANGPELIPPSEWISLVFNDQEAGYETQDEANPVLQVMMALLDRNGTGSLFLPFDRIRRLTAGRLTRCTMTIRRHGGQPRSQQSARRHLRNGLHRRTNRSYLCLNEHWVLTLQEAQLVIEALRREYNEERTHSAIGNVTPYEFILHYHNGTHLTQERTSSAMV